MLPQTGSVRINRPKSLCVAEIAVDVFPAVIENASIVQNSRVALKERAFGNLMDIGSVTVHLEQVAHDVAIAAAILRLAR